MRPRAGLIGFLASLLIASTVVAQYGHPLKGSWSGDWGTSKENRHRVLLELNWNGKEITGTINPGPQGVPLKTATLNPADWTVRLEADSKIRGGWRDPLRHRRESGEHQMVLPCDHGDLGSGDAER